MDMLLGDSKITIKTDYMKDVKRKKGHQGKPDGQSEDQFKTFTRGSTVALELLVAYKTKHTHRPLCQDCYLSVCHLYHVKGFLLLIILH